MATERKYLSLDKLGLYDEKIKKVIADGDAASLKSSKEYADSLAVNYDAAGAAATAEANAKAHADSKDTAIAEAKKAGTDAAAAAKVADEKAVAAQTAVDTLSGEVSELEEYVGTIPEGYSETNVVAYINKKAEETLNAASGGSTESAASVKAALDAYKAENDPKVAANTKAAADAQSAADAAQDAVDALSETHATDKAALEAADAGQIERIAALEGQIGGVTGAMHFKGVKDAVPEDKTGYVSGDTIIVGNKEYVFDGTDFKEFGDASVNADLIAGLTGRVDTVEDDIDAAEGRLDAVEGAVATKVEQSAYNAKIGELAGADSAMAGRLDAIEAQLGEGEGSVAEQIEEAKQDAISAAGTAADTKDAEILKQAKAHAEGLNTAMSARVDALEAVDHEHANKDLLDSYTQTEADLADAVAKKHEHANKTVIDGITAEKVAAWDAAEANAKAYADGLDTAMGARVTAVEAWQASMIEISEAEINAMFQA